MSTEHQRYSPEAQRAAIASYAADNGYEIVKTYTDLAKSGLTLRGRDGLKALMADVLSGASGYEVVLVYDVSRWGRFQDVDQSAHYEFVCREAGVQIEYCAEEFRNDGSPVSTLVKTIKRVMAAEYSRELSTRVSRVQHALAAQGYWQGGGVPYGLRRQPMTPEGKLRPVLDHGEANGVRGDRILLVPGPESEVAVVRRIFREFLSGLTMSAIARRLTDEGVPPPLCGQWHVATVGTILRNEIYIGNYVSGRTRQTLGVRRRQPRASWRRKIGAFAPIIPEWLFDLTQRQFRNYVPNPTDEEMIEALRRLYKREGYLSRALIAADRQSPGTTAYFLRFGSMANAYSLAGYTPTAISTAEASERDRKRRRQRNLERAKLKRIAALELNDPLST